MNPKYIIPLLITISSVMASSPAMQGVTPSPVVIEKTAVMGNDYAQGGLYTRMQEVRIANMQSPRDEREEVHMSFPVILGSYRDSDDQDTVVAMLQQELFDGPWNTPTMAEHYLEMSYGQFHLSGTVYGWYELSSDGDFYEGSQSEPYDNGFGNPPGGTGSFLQESLDLADVSVDFSQYDSDGPDGIPNSGDDDGFVDAAFFVHSGRGGEGGGPYIWSHRWVYSGWWGSSYQTNDMGANGTNIRINDYIMQPAASTGGGLIEIGVFSHEFGHALGLPDLYDTDYSSGGVGSWCLMASGSWSTPSSPVHFSAWCKEMMGWLQPYQPTDNIESLEFSTAAMNPFAVKLWTHGQVTPHVGSYSHGQDVGREYYLIENRQRQGTENHLPGTGLIIWHVDNTRWSNSDENHRMVDVIPADGYFNGSSPGDAWPGTTNNRNFDFETIPPAIGWDGENTQVAVLNISDNDTLMYADVEVHEVNPHIRIADYTITDENNDRIYAPGETVEIWLTVTNSGGNASNLTATITSEQDVVDVFGDLVEFPDVDFMETTFANDPIEFVISDSLEPQAVTFDIAFLSDEMATAYHQELTLLVGLPQVALIDDDGAASGAGDYADYFKNALSIANVVYTYWDVASEGLPDQSWLDASPNLIWFRGDQGEALDIERMDMLGSYLDQGGNAILSGQGIAHEDASTPSFLSTYFGARLTENSVSSAYLYGDPEHELMDNSDRFSIAGAQGAGNQDSPDAVTPVEGGESLFIYPFTGGQSAGTSKQTSQFNSMFLAFGFEALAPFSGDGDTARAAIMDRMVDWVDLRVTGVVDGEPQLAELQGITGAYPNPFNPEINFKLSLNARSDYALEIYDLRGILVSQQEVSGSQVVWSPGANLAGGVYLAILLENGQATSSLKKVTYLK